MGKGSSPRPFAVSNEEYKTRWDAIFGRDNEEENHEKALRTGESDQPCDFGGGNNSGTPAGQAKTA